MTELQRIYRAHRSAGHGHGETLDKMADDLGLDRETVFRSLERADQRERDRLRRRAQKARA